MTHSLILFITACVFGLGMTWGVGANDLANVMSTSIGSKTITMRQAIIITILFEIAGALLGGSDVARTIQNGIINTQALNHTPEVLSLGMLAALLASSIWMAFASFIAMPVSITNAIVGSVVGFGLIVLGVHAIHWSQIGVIALTWVLAPSVAGLISYLLFISVQKSILSVSNPLTKAKRYFPIYLFIVGFILAEMTIIKAIDHFEFQLNFWQNVTIAMSCGILILIIGQIILHRIHIKANRHHRVQFAGVEKMFGVLMLFTVCAMVYAHGSNDIAIAMGPIATIASILKVGHPFHNGSLIFMTLGLGCFGVIIGFLTYGRKVVQTVGSGITTLTPSRAYCATISAATTVVIATSVGIPVSATQTLVGAVLGVGLARGIGALDLRVIRNIFTSWIITIPVAAVLTTICYYLLKFIF